jgi:hypothetical protein
LTTNSEEDNRILEKLKHIENRLRRIEEDAQHGIEDQFFFGIVFSLLLLFITLPTTELASFLESFRFLEISLFSSDLAAKTAEGVRYFGILFMLLSALLRYHGALSEKRLSKSERYYSIFFFLMGLEFLIFIFGMNVSSVLSVQIGSVNVEFGIFVLGIAFLTMVKIEKKILNFYASKGLIHKKHTEPDISKTLSAIIFTIFGTPILAQMTLVYLFSFLEISLIGVQITYIVYSFVLFFVLLYVISRFFKVPLIFKVQSHS